MEQKVKSTLDAVSFVYTTADMWKAHNKSFFSMTIHWIDTNTLEHCKAAISCSRLVECHIYDALAGFLSGGGGGEHLPPLEFGLPPLEFGLPP